MVESFTSTGIPGIAAISAAFSASAWAIIAASSASAWAIRASERACSVSEPITPASSICVPMAVNSAALASNFLFAFTFRAKISPTTTIAAAAAPIATSIAVR